MQLRYLTDYRITSKRVMLRADMNVPIKDGKVENEERIDRSLKTIKFILDQGGKLNLVTHLGRPQESNKVQEEFSLRPIAECLEKKLNRPIVIEESLHALNSSKAELAMLENIRFFDGEQRNSPQLAKELTKNCDLFVNDAFATSHRAHASTVGVVDFVNEACAGFLIKEELDEFEQAIKEKNLKEIADSLTDILYVTYGAGHAFGIDLDKCFDEVQRSNMSKLGEDGKPIYNEYGKVMKGPNYFEPNLKKFIE